MDKNILPTFAELEQMIGNSRRNVAVNVNAEITLLYWNIGKYIRAHYVTGGRAEYGKEILPTLSAKLVKGYGKGFSERNLAKMIKLHELFPDEYIFQFLSEKLSWSHFVELISIKTRLQREFYYTICIHEKWGVRQLRDKINSGWYERTAIASPPEVSINTERYNLSNTDKC